MATKMAIAELELVDETHPERQRAAVLEDHFEISCAWAKIPEPGPDEIRVKMKYVGICGSDLESFRGSRRPEFLSTPARLGHEVGGVIDRVGDDVVGLKVGDRVTCRYVWGAFAEYITCRPFNVKVVPPDFPLLETSPLEVLPGIIHAAELARITTRSDVLVMGQGVSGLIMTQMLKLYSPRSLVVTDLKDRNLELARKYGATHAYKLPAIDASTMETVGKDFPDGFDVVIPCLLDGEGMIDAVDCAGMGSRIVMYGCIGDCRKPFDWLKVHRRRLEIYSTEPRRDVDMRRYYQEGVQMVLDGLINTREFITDIVPLSEIEKGFALRDETLNDSIHVLIDCEK